MALNPKNRTRAITVEGTDIGVTRYKLYRKAFSRINESIEQGFYLEAIAIIESLISDRLESRLTFLKGSDFGFKTLGTLIRETKNVESDLYLKDLITNELNSWREIRNKAVHELPKLAHGDTSTWDDRIQALIPCAEDGRAILQAIHKRCRQLRRA